jgi:hypothetical protein
MAARVTVRSLTPADFGNWNSLVARSRTGSIYNTTEYLEVLSSVTNGRFKIVIAERSGEFQGGLAIYEESSRLGRFVSTRLLLYYNGFVLPDHLSKYPSERTSRHTEAMQQLEAAVSNMGYGRVRIRNRSTFQDARVFQSAGWSVSPSYSYVVDLSDLPAQWERVEQNLRRLVQRCEREGVLFSDDDDFDSFLRMHELTVTRKGMTAYLPSELFKKYFVSLKSRNLCRLFHARLPNGRAISSQLVLLGAHPVTHSVSAALDPEYMKTGATAYLRWKAFEALANLGYAANDLTDAELNPVTHFKSQLGGNLETSLVLAGRDSGRFRSHTALLRGVGAAKNMARPLYKTIFSRKPTV